MWKKKHANGTVTIYDDDVTSSAATTHDEFGDLGLGSHGRPQAYGREHGLEKMSASELEAAALSAADEGRQGTSRALAMALETREIGVNTAQTLKQQTEQLERMGEEIEVVHDYLDKSERIIDKMTKPKIVRMFQRPKKSGKGLDKVKAGKKDQAEREALKARGLGAVDLDAMAGSERSADSGFSAAADADELFEAHHSKRGGPRSNSASNPSYQTSRHIQEDYSQYSSGVAASLRKQDQDLDQISDALADMKALADGMNAELTYQGKLIDEIQDFTEETSRRTKDHARRVNQIK